MPMPQNPAPAAAAQISIRLDAEGDSDRVELRIRERGGEVQVAVRTSDAEMAGSLRQDLGELVKRLENRSSSASELPNVSNQTPANAQGNPDLTRFSMPNQAAGFAFAGDPQGRQRQQQQRQNRQSASADSGDDSGNELRTNFLSAIQNGVNHS